MLLIRYCKMLYYKDSLAVAFLTLFKNKSLPCTTFNSLLVANIIEVISYCMFYFDINLRKV